MKFIKLNLYAALPKDVLSTVKVDIFPDTAVETIGIAADSRESLTGKIFVAIQGGRSDGHDFIEAAFAAGAVLVVGQRPFPDAQGPYIQVRDSRQALARLACEFYGHPSQKMTMIGVTGTAGKTTTTYVIESILQAAGKNVGLIGTVNFRFGAKVYPSTHTTPGPLELQALLAEMLSDGCNAVVMEVSSHALKQNRTGSIAFDGMVFTNLSPEHLDFHPDLEDYFESKALLFTRYLDESVLVGKKPTLAINLDSDYGRKLFDRVSNTSHPGTACIGFQLSQAPELEYGLQGLSGEMSGVSVRSHLVGAFNASNVFGAVTVAKGLGIPDEAISRGVTALKYVPGRLEMVPTPPESGISVIVDYAHKSDALEKVLQSLRGLVPRGKGRLITVFGCGGDRDRTKRPVMGEIATRLSDHVIVTSDNPRTENPAKIIEGIVGGIQAGSYFVELDRRKAIFLAIEKAKTGDLIVIAGKGHEDYQILGTTKIHFDDREIALEALTQVFKSL